MKSDEKNVKKSTELSEEELGDVAGGFGANGPMTMNASTMPFQPGMAMNPSTMQYQPGMDPMQAQTLERQMGGIPGTNTGTITNSGSSTHSV